jgi:2-polyprenyl-6-methoxyphenol hydroxylase-like FAD-dependent oxidoreductase
MRDAAGRQVADTAQTPNRQTPNRHTPDHQALDRQTPNRPPPIGKQAVVIGAGIAGIAAAVALAGWFEQVIVLEQDRLSETPEHRSGTSQGWHAHGLLVGGLVAMETLFPGLGADFARAGAVPLRINRDFREEPANRDPMPQRDFGISGYTMTRPLIEATLRRHASQHPNVVFRSDTQALCIEASPDAKRIAAVRCASGDERVIETIPADVVVDASGRGQLTTDLLQWTGRPGPAETAIGVDICYSTAVLDVPDNAPSDWRMVLTHADAPRISRRAVLLPIEGNRWMITVTGRGADRPPAQWDALLDYLRQLATPTIYNAVRHTRPAGRLARFLFPKSVWKHFESLEALPDGLIPIGDAICRFNPIYGQGMTVAAKQAVLLGRLLASHAAQPDPLAGLGQAFLDQARPLIQTPWSMAAVPDFAFPATYGDRPADLQHSLRFAGALSRLAARDEAVQKLTVEVWQMLKPYSALQDPELVARVEEEMAEA